MSWDKDQEKDAIREEEKEMPVGEVTVIKEKKGLFNLWENRKRKRSRNGIIIPGVRN